MNITGKSAYWELDIHEEICVRDDFEQSHLYSCAPYYVFKFSIEQRLKKYSKPLYAHGQKKNNTVNHMHTVATTKCKEGQTYMS